jgi:hypothetical protein
MRGRVSASRSCVSLLLWSSCPSQFRCHLRFDEARHFFFARKRQLIFRYEKPVIHAGQGIFDQNMVLFSAEQNANKQVIVFRHFMHPKPIDIGVELTQVLVGKAADFEFNQDVTFENAVIEDQIDGKMFVADEKALWRASKQKPRPTSSRKSWSLSRRAFSSADSLITSCGCRPRNSKM